MLLFNLAGKLAAVWIGFAAPPAALALFLVPDALIAYHVFMPHAQGIVRSPRRFATSRREVWLTIDDGPDPEDTPRILALLAAHEARATFFVIGENALAHPELVQAMVAGGHEVANHTHTHPLGSFWCASPARVRRELDDATAALCSLGVTPTRFRPPANLRNLWLAAALRVRGLTCINWTTRGLERRSAEPATVAKRVLRGLAPGSIFLMHEGVRVPPAVRVHAIRQVLEQASAQGYRFVVPSPEQLIF